MNSFMYRRLLYMLSLLCVLFFASECKSKKKQEPYVQQPLPVLIADVISANVPIVKSSFGTLLSPITITLIAQVSGQLISVPVSEGAFVKKGDLIAKIDPRIYEANLMVANANLLRDQAALLYAKQTLASYAELLPQNYVSQLNYEQYEQNVAQAQAAVDSDLASLALAKINLEYTEIRAPMDGVVGFFQVNQGNFITAGSSNATITTFLQVAPIYALYAIPEVNLDVLRSNQAKSPLKVTASFLDNLDKAIIGEVVVINNTVDTTTGTILVKAVFPNKDLFGWPGQFVRLKTELYRKENAVLIPVSAVQTGQKGDFVYVVGSNGTVQVRPIVTGEYLEGEVVIQSGLEVGEVVVTDGQINLYPGAPVQPMQELPLNTGSA
ncbi:MAG: efflux RND transporter periplasmic adaptor subunit [Chlamydiales bacterium]|nr:efflux RND transporter periplasmic adaptor subunit [Chlamydiales bacterium]